MKIFRAAALICLLAAPAHAQMPNVNLIPETPSKTQEQIEQEQAQDKAYKDSLRKIPDAKGSNDPWGGVRSADAPPPKAEKRVQAKPKAKIEAKTGGTAN